MLLVHYLEYSGGLLIGLVSIGLGYISRGFVCRVLTCLQGVQVLLQPNAKYIVTTPIYFIGPTVFATHCYALGGGQGMLLKVGSRKCVVCPIIEVVYCSTQWTNFFHGAYLDVNHYPEMRNS
jgi:hypothetical protein